MRDNKEILSELLTIQEFLGEKPAGDMNVMTMKLDMLIVYLSTTASLVADAEFWYNKAKRDAYYALEARYKEKERKFTPSLAKDFISADIAEETYAYTLAQRLNAAVTHSIEGLRTLISAEKSMLTNLR